MGPGTSIRRRIQLITCLVSELRCNPSARARRKKRKKKKAKKARFVGGKRKKGQKKFKSRIVPALPQPATSRADSQNAALRAP